MKTLTVRLPVQIAAQVAGEARARHISKSDVVRERLAAPDRARTAGPARLEAIADLIGCVDALPATLSARRKAYLKKTRYGRKHAR